MTFLRLILNRDIGKLKDKGTILILGDLNARIGTKNDFLKPNKFDLNLDPETDDPLARNSEDLFSNTRGDELLGFCKTNNYIITNGRKLGDIFGSYTSQQWNGSSVVDYLLTPNSDFDKIITFSIGNYNHWLSDHCPLYTELNLTLPTENNINEKIKTHKKEPAFLWNQKYKEDFRDNLRNDTVKSKIDDLLRDHLQISLKFA